MLVRTHVDFQVLLLSVVLAKENDLKVTVSCILGHTIGTEIHLESKPHFNEKISFSTVGVPFS